MRQGETGQGEFSILVLVVGAVLCIGAGVLIVSFLGDSHPEEVTGQLGFTALSLAIFGPCAAAGLQLAQRRPRLAPLGLLIAAIAVLTFAAFTIRAFEEGLTFFLVGWELQFVGLALTLALAEVALVLAYDSNDDPPWLRLVALGTILSILALGVLIALQVVFHDFRPSAGLYGVLATLNLLGAALLVLFRLDAWQRSRGGLPAKA